MAHPAHRAAANGRNLGRIYVGDGIAVAGKSLGLLLSLGGFARKPRLFVGFNLRSRLGEQAFSRNILGARLDRLAEDSIDLLLCPDFI